MWRVYKQIKDIMEKAFQESLLQSSCIPQSKRKLGAQEVKMNANIHYKFSFHYFKIVICVGSVMSTLVRTEKDADSYEEAFEDYMYQMIEDKDI